MHVRTISLGRPDVELRLSAYEAAVLLALTGYVAGDPSGPRGVINELRRELLYKAFAGDNTARVSREFNITVDGAVYVKHLNAPE